MDINIEKALDASLTLQERVRIVLNSYHDREPRFTSEEIAKKINSDAVSVYQALWRLQKAGEIELIKQPIGTYGKEKVAGAKLIRVEPTGKTYYRAAKRASTKYINNNGQHKEMASNMPELSKYLRKKTAIEEAKQNLAKAGLDPSIIQFETEPLGEEAIAILSLYQEALTKLEKSEKEKQMLEFDVAACKRDIEYLKSKSKEETREELLAGTH